MIYILMILCAIGMIVGHLQYKSKGVLWGRPLSGALGIVVVVLACAQIGAVITKPGKQREMIVKTDLQYSTIAMQYLGTYLATNFPDHRILLITRPVTESFKATHETMLKGLKKGLGGQLKIMAEKAPPRSVADLIAGNDASDEFEFTAEQFDQLLKLHPECNLILSLIGLPKDFSELQLWTMKPEQRPKVVLGFANIFELKSAIEMDFISAALIYNRSYRPTIGEAIPEDLSEAFNKRFQLVTKTNVDEIAAQNSRMFKPEVKEDDDDEEG